MNENKKINEIISETMPKKLKEFRKQSGMKIEEVSKLINKTPAMISNYENGNNIPSAAVLFELCKIYGIEDINEVFHDEFLTQNLKNNDYLTKPEFELLQLWRSAKKEGKFAAKIVLEAFKQSNLNN